MSNADACLFHTALLPELELLVQRYCRQYNLVFPNIPGRFSARRGRYRGREVIHIYKSHNPASVFGHLHIDVVTHEMWRWGGTKPFARLDLGNYYFGNYAVYHESDLSPHFTAAHLAAQQQLFREIL